MNSDKHLDIKILRIEERDFKEFYGVFYRYHIMGEDILTGVDVIQLYKEGKDISDIVCYSNNKKSNGLVKRMIQLKDVYNINKIVDEIVNSPEKYIIQKDDELVA